MGCTDEDTGPAFPHLGDIADGRIHHGGEATGPRADRWSGIPEPNPGEPMEAHRPPMPSPPIVSLLIGLVAFVVGLALGKDQGDAETTRNTFSAILLTIGFIIVVVSLVIVAIRKARLRRS